MNRTQLEHIIRAASRISDDAEIVVIGSQAVHAQDMRLPPIAFISEEVDVYPRHHPEGRLIRLSNANTDGATGFCLDVHDLVLSKYAAGREKDLEFNKALVHYGCVTKTTLLALAEEMPVDGEMKEIVLHRINAHFADMKP
jgi:hypothetical protein